MESKKMKKLQKQKPKNKNIDGVNKEDLWDKMKRLRSIGGRGHMLI